MRRYPYAEALILIKKVDRQQNKLPTFTPFVYSPLNTTINCCSYPKRYTEPQKNIITINQKKLPPCSHSLICNLINFINPKSGSEVSQMVYSHHNR